MVHSMTGYGEASGTYEQKKIRVELRSLNGKSTDVRIKMPSLYRTKELILRNIVLQSAKRGKLDLSIVFEGGEGDESYKINSTLTKKYFLELSSVAKELSVSSEGLLNAVLKIPNVIAVDDVTVSEAEWTFVENLVLKAIESLKSFRANEGAALEKDLSNHVLEIENQLEKVKEFEPGRIELLRSRFHKNLLQFTEEVNVDKNRFEQELMYYIEKLDISEEKIRLKQHCEYFKEILSKEDVAKGKKLNFISQEMGREMNTMGSKAQNSSIQQLVILMKDYLEKIKEQVLNIV